MLPHSPSRRSAARRSPSPPGDAAGGRPIRFPGFEPLPLFVADRSVEFYRSVGSVGWHGGAVNAAGGRGKGGRGGARAQRVAVERYLDIVEREGDDLMWKIVLSQRGTRSAVAFGPDRCRPPGFYLYAIASE